GCHARLAVAPRGISSPVAEFQICAQLVPGRQAAMYDPSGLNEIGTCPSQIVTSVMWGALLSRGKMVSVKLLETAIRLPVGLQTRHSPPCPIGNPLRFCRPDDNTARSAPV